MNQKPALSATIANRNSGSREGNPRGHSDRILLLIGVFKLVKASLLVIVAVGALNLLHRDVATVAANWIAALRVDPENYYFHLIVGKLLSVDDRVLAEVSAGSLFYAVLLAVEGVGLCLRKRWAEYLTIIITASFLPLEIYALTKHFSVLKVLLTLANAAIVWYLVRCLRRDRQSAHSSQPS